MVRALVNGCRGSFVAPPAYGACLASLLHPRLTIVNGQSEGAEEVVVEYFRSNPKAQVNSGGTDKATLSEQ